MSQPRQSSMWIWLSLLAFALLCAVTYHRRQLPFVNLNDLTTTIAEDVLSSPLHNASESINELEHNPYIETDIRGEAEKLDGSGQYDRSYSRRVALLGIGTRLTIVLQLWVHRPTERLCSSLSSTCSLYHGSSLQVPSDTR